MHFIFLIYEMYIRLSDHKEINGIIGNKFSLYHSALT